MSQRDADRKQELSNDTESAANSGEQATRAAPFASPRTGGAARPLWLMALEVLASLRLTVVLFALSMGVVLIGTLAQYELDMWQVLDEYFGAWICYVPIRFLFPPSFFPEFTKSEFFHSIENLRVLYPGGALVGLGLIVNLLAAHLVRFKVQASGSRLKTGLGVFGLGVLATILVVLGGNSTGGLHGKPWLSYGAIWQLFKVGLLALWGLLCYYTLHVEAQRRFERRFWITTTALLGLVVVAVLLNYQYQPADASMRVLWQLMQGLGAGAVLLAGSLFLFRQRAGIVVIHAGVGLLMLGVWLAASYSVEERMQLFEGEATNVTKNLNRIELSVVDDSPEDHLDITVVPLALIDEGRVVAHDDLPFDVRMDKFFPNAMVITTKAPITRNNPEIAKNLATAGLGLDEVVLPQRQSSGADSEGGVDQHAAYVTFLKKGTEESLGTYLLSAIQDLTEAPERVEVDGKTYAVQLQFHRTYHPFTVTLDDVVAENYEGTATPRDYSSYVRLHSEERHEDVKARIWMNNPLRFDNLTFYQSGYNVVGGRELTDLQVVRNQGWMLPYIACGVVFVGMLHHFLAALTRFLGRAARSGSRSVGGAPQPGDRSLAWRGGWVTLGIGAGLVALLLGAELSRSRRAYERGEFDLAAAARLPVMYEGRVKPLDTIARNMLRAVSNREYFLDGAKQKRQAIEFLLDMLSERRVPAQSEKAEEAQQGQQAAGDEPSEGEPAAADDEPRLASAQAQIIRIEHPEVLELFGLQARPGNFRYSIDELLPKYEEFQTQVKEASDVPGPDRSVYQQNLLKLAGRVHALTMVRAPFDPPPAALGNRQVMIRWLESLLKDDVPRAIPRNAMSEQLTRLFDTVAPNEEWLPYAVVKTLGEVQGAPDDQDSAIASWTTLLAAYREGDAQRFNATVHDYLERVDRRPAGSYRPEKAEAEARFNRANLFGGCMILYVAAFLCGIVGMLLPNHRVRQVAFWVTVSTLIVHSVALYVRIKISGRPPVTNLYSSAIFIGWGTVLLGCLIEAFIPLGIASLMATVGGFCSLLIAHFLAAEGKDTIEVLRAVLDTQFWLATHVTSITFGYAATFAAGLLGVVMMVWSAFEHRTPLSIALQVIWAGIGLAAIIALGMVWPLYVWSSVGLVVVVMMVAYPFIAKQQRSSTGSSSGGSSDLIKEMGRMAYGILCFAILFSFVGTVLGGLWADDSWGRFWGWDPKENGALLIVIWNAIVLHARWGKMVGDRGVGALAVAGNIVTAWSWFGTNQLGFGLHAYGSTEGTAQKLMWFFVSQLALVGLGVAAIWVHRRAIAAPPSDPMAAEVLAAPLK